MSDIFYLPRAEQKELAKRLSEIPGLCEDLAITEQRQDRIARRGLNFSAPAHDSSRVVWHEGASRAMDALHNELTTWIRLCCEHRGQDYPTEAISTIGAGAWLRKYVTVLALTPGSENAKADICYRMRVAYDAIDLPAVTPPRKISPDEIEKANRQIVTAPQVEVIARRLGGLGAGLDRHRVYRMVDAKALRPLVNLVKGDKPQLHVEPYRFRLGDVLHAHYSQKKRKRKKAS